MPGKFNVVQASIRIEFHGEMNLIPACGIIAMHPDRGIGQLAKIPRPARMIEDDFLIEFFDFRDHGRGWTGDRPSLGEKKRAAAWRISTMRSISSIVL